MPLPPTAAIPEQHEQAFVALQGVPVYFFGEVTKYNKKWDKESRVVVVSEDKVFTARKDGDICRHFEVAKIKELFVNPTKLQVAIKVPTQYDVCVQTNDCQKLVDVLCMIYSYNERGGKLPVLNLGESDSFGKGRFDVRLQKPRTYKRNVAKEIVQLGDEVSTPPEERLDARLMDNVSQPGLSPGGTPSHASSAQTQPRIPKHSSDYSQSVPPLNLSRPDAPVTPTESHSQTFKSGRGYQPDVLPSTAAKRFMPARESSLVTVSAPVVQDSPHRRHLHSSVGYAGQMHDHGQYYTTASDAMREASSLLPDFSMPSLEQRSTVTVHMPLRYPDVQEEAPLVDHPSQAETQPPPPGAYMPEEPANAAQECPPPPPPPTLSHLSQSHANVLLHASEVSTAVPVQPPREPSSGATQSTAYSQTQPQPQNRQHNSYMTQLPELTPSSAGLPSDQATPDDFLPAGLQGSLRQPSGHLEGQAPELPDSNPPMSAQQQPLDISRGPSQASQPSQSSHHSQGVPESAAALHGPPVCVPSEVQHTSGPVSTVPTGGQGPSAGAQLGQAPLPDSQDTWPAGGGEQPQYAHPMQEAPQTQQAEPDPLPPQFARLPLSQPSLSHHSASAPVSRAATPLSRMDTPVQSVADAAASANQSFSLEGQFVTPRSGQCTPVSTPRDVHPEPRTFTPPCDEDDEVQALVASARDDPPRVPTPTRAEPAVEAHPHMHMHPHMPEEPDTYMPSVPLPSDVVAEIPLPESRIDTYIPMPEELAQHAGPDDDMYPFDTLPPHKALAGRLSGALSSQDSFVARDVTPLAGEGAGPSGLQGSASHVQVPSHVASSAGSHRQAHPASGRSTPVSRMSRSRGGTPPLDMDGSQAWQSMPSGSVDYAPSAGWVSQRTMSSMPQGSTQLRPSVPSVPSQGTPAHGPGATPQLSHVSGPRSSEGAAVPADHPHQQVDLYVRSRTQSQASQGTHHSQTSREPSHTAQPLSHVQQFPHASQPSREPSHAQLSQPVSQHVQQFPPDSQPPREPSHAQLSQPVSQHVHQFPQDSQPSREPSHAQLSQPVSQHVQQFPQAPSRVSQPSYPAPSIPSRGPSQVSYPFQPVPQEPSRGDSQEVSSYDQPQTMQHFTSHPHSNQETAVPPPASRPHSAPPSPPATASSPTSAAQPTSSHGAPLSMPERAHVPPVAPVSPPPDYVELPWGRSSPAGKLAEREHQRAIDAEVKAAQLLSELMGSMPQPPPQHSDTHGRSPSASTAHTHASATSRAPLAGPLEVSLSVEADWVHTLGFDNMKKLRLAVACDTAAAIAIQPHCIALDEVCHDATGNAIFPFRLVDVPDPAATSRRFVEMNTASRIPVPESMRVIRDLGGLQPIRSRRASGSQASLSTLYEPPTRFRFGSMESHPLPPGTPSISDNAAWHQAQLPMPPPEPLPLPLPPQQPQHQPQPQPPQAGRPLAGLDINVGSLSPRRKAKQVHYPAAQHETRAMAHRREAETAALTGEVNQLKQALVTLGTDDYERSRQQSQACRDLERQLQDVQATMAMAEHQNSEQQQQGDMRAVALQQELRRLEKEALDKDMRFGDERRQLEGQLLQLRDDVHRIAAEKDVRSATEKQALTRELGMLRDKIHTMEQQTQQSERCNEGDRRKLEEQVLMLQSQVGDASVRDVERVDGVLRYAQEGDLAVLHELEKVKHEMQAINDQHQVKGRRVSESRARMECEMETMRTSLADKERAMNQETSRLEMELKNMKRGMMELSENQSHALLRERDQLEHELLQVKSKLSEMMHAHQLERERTERTTNAVLEQAEAIAYSGKTQVAAETEQKLAALESQLHQQNKRDADMLQTSYTRMLAALEEQVQMLHKDLLRSQEREVGVKRQIENIHAESQAQMRHLQQREATVKQQMEHMQAESQAQMRQLQQESSQREAQAHAALAESEALRFIQQQAKPPRPLALPPLPPVAKPANPRISPKRPQHPGTPRQALPVPTPSMLQGCPEYVSVMEHLGRVHSETQREIAEKEARLRAVISLTEKTREEGDRGHDMQVMRLEERLAHNQAAAEEVRRQIAIARDQLVAAREMRLRFLKERQRPSKARSTPRKDTATLPPPTPQTPNTASAVPPSSSRPATPGATAGLPPPAPVAVPQAQGKAMPSEALSPGATRLEQGYTRLQELQRELESAQRELQDAAQGSPAPRVSPAVSPVKSVSVATPTTAAPVGDFPSEQEILQNLRTCLNRTDTRDG